MILAITRDTGGTNGLLPVIRVLRQMGHKVKIYAHGVAVDILRANNENFFIVDAPKEILNDYLENAEAFITTSCSDIGAGLITPLHSVCPSILIQDFWGGEMLRTWSAPEQVPDWTLVNDKVGVNILLHHWQGLRREQILVTGFPALDKYTSVNTESERITLRKNLGLMENWPLIFFAGQFKYTTEILMEVIDVLNNLGENFYIVASPHPNLAKEWPEGFKLWQEAVKKIPDFYKVDRPAHVTTAQLIAGSDMVISIFSTVLIEAVALRKFNIAGLYAPGTNSEDFKRDTFLGLDSLPLVDLGCTAGVLNRQEMIQNLAYGLNRENPLLENQKRYFRLDGRNSGRAAQAISDIINNKTPEGVMVV